MMDSFPEHRTVKIAVEITVHLLDLFSLGVDGTFMLIYH